MQPLPDLPAAGFGRQISVRTKTAISAVRSLTLRLSRFGLNHKCPVLRQVDAPGGTGVSANPLLNAFPSFLYLREMLSFRASTSQRTDRVQGRLSGFQVRGHGPLLDPSLTSS